MRLRSRRAIDHGLSPLAEGRLVVGAAAAAVTGIVATILEIVPPPALLIAIGAATVVIYDLDRLIDRRSDGARVPRVVGITLALALVTLGLVLGSIRTETALVLLGGLPLSALYAIPIARRGGRRDGRRLKDHPVGKVLFVATAVSTATVTLPLLEARHAPSGVELALAVSWVFVAILGNTIACDLRDRAADARAGIETLAVRWGPTRGRSRLIALHLAGAGIAGLFAAAGILPWATVVPFLATSLLLGISGRPPRWVGAVGFDGTFVLAGLLSLSVS